jgi:hypothetical protein
VVQGTEQQCRATLVNAVINVQGFYKLAELLDDLSDCHEKAKSAPSS